ncbi:pyridine nucleotide-disulfide oxidoreductase [marine bacterium AO1-C]|nr:pyridine nucleotide-disulfide oxidoreductase [marine bacterium AO1-C]
MEKNNTHFDVIIVGGSYSGLAAGMALGRALRKVLIIDSGKPCNRQTPHSHNFITQDGKTPQAIAELAKLQVQQYPTVSFFEGLAIQGAKTKDGFEIQTKSGKIFQAKQLIFASGIKDIFPDIEGFAQCWGISILHCPYCHGYEVRNKPTGILGNGELGFEFARFITNWTKDVTLYTNGPSTLTADQTTKLKNLNIKIEEAHIKRFIHEKGHLKHIQFKGRDTTAISVIYAKVPFVQHCGIPETLGCVLNEDGFLQVDPKQQTSVEGVYACGDNTTRMRTVANAVSMGTTAGMMSNKAFVLSNF